MKFKSEKKKEQKKYNLIQLFPELITTKRRSEREEEDAIGNILFCLPKASFIFMFALLYIQGIDIDKCCME